MATINASWDLLVFVQVLQRKMRSVGGELLRRYGVIATAIPKLRQEQMKTARIVDAKFANGIFLVEDKELDQLIDLAAWLAQKHQEINRHPQRTTEIQRSHFIATGKQTTPPADPSSYRRASTMASELLAS